MQSTMLNRVGLAGGWAQEAALALLALAWGFGVMPGLIYLAGANLLGRYDSGSAARLYESIYADLGMGSTASWAVVLGPYGLYLAFKGLRAWWRASSRLA